MVASKPKGLVKLDFLKGFNPLHCGAVVASRPPCAPPPSMSGCFNPLHCGAVVASPARRRRRLPAAPGFNPLHCGAVVASRRFSSASGTSSLVSIPFIAGQWSLPARRGARRKETVKVSIPFIAGQWSLPAAARDARRGARRLVSIPFIAGQWSLRAESAEDVDILLACFNPLHCGAVVASPAWRCSASSPPGVSIPFIAGQWSLQTWKRFFSAARRLFQSPSLRGSGRFFRSGERTRARRTPRFNPLHCGAVVASWTI